MEITLGYIVFWTLCWIRRRQAAAPREMTLQERWRLVTQRRAVNSRPGQGSPRRVSSGPRTCRLRAQAFPSGPEGLPPLLPAAICPLSKGNPTPIPGASSRHRRRRHRRGGDETPGSGPTKASGQPGAGTTARPAPPQGARAPGSRFRGGPPLPSRPTNSHFLPHSQPIPTLHEE